MTESDTPRTDAEVQSGETTFGAEFVLANFARHMERELNIVTAQRDALRANFKEACADEIERIQRLHTHSKNENLLLKRKLLRLIMALNRAPSSSCHKPDEIFQKHSEYDEWWQNERIEALAEITDNHPFRR